eukprot:COSAG06_NODE_354_length_16880_cov_7.746545_3_plen_203_part_00
MFLRLLIEYLTVAQTEPTTTLEGVSYAFGLFATAQVQSLALHQYFHRVFRVGMHARTSVITSVYRKSLRLSMGAKQSETVGQMVNLMAVDARRPNDLLPYLHNIWSSPLQIIISLTMLWNQIGPAVLAGLAVMLIVMPLNALMARIQQRIQHIRRVCRRASDSVQGGRNSQKLRRHTRTRAAPEAMVGAPPSGGCRYRRLHK